MDGAGHLEAEPGDDPSPVRAPADDGAAPVVVDGGGAYRRDPDGVWRRVATGEAVPGAVDVRLRDLFDPPVVELPHGPARRVPRAWARRHPDHPLAWAFTYSEPGSRAPLDVPVADWDARADDVVGLLAPELHPAALLGVDAVASIAGIDPRTLRAYLARRQVPEPVARVGGSPVWTRPVVEAWLAGRRRARRD